MPSTLLIGERDLVTRGIPSGRVGGQRNLEVEVVQGAAHWLPEQRSELIADGSTVRDQLTRRVSFGDRRIEQRHVDSVDAHQLVAAPGALQIRHEAVGVPEASRLEGVVDGAGVGEPDGHDGA